MKKRALIFLFVVGLLSVAVVNAQTPITLVYWSMWNETEGQALVIQDAIAKFEAQNPNIKIEAVWNGTLSDIAQPSTS